MRNPAVPLDARESDPRELGWMSGHPPAPERLVRFADGSFLKFPQTRWSYSHMRELRPSARVDRGSAPVLALPYELRSDLDEVAVTMQDGRTMNWRDSLMTNYTDGIVVLQRGKIVFERYFGALDPTRTHIAFSVTKSFVGTAAALLAARGDLDEDEPVLHYLPELAHCAYADASVRQVMDMTIGVDCSEDYTDPAAGVWNLMRACGMLPLPEAYEGPRALYDFIRAVGRLGSHGEAFAYRTINTEVLAWILRRVSGTGLAALLSELFWSRLGVERDAEIIVDPAGTELGGLGLCTTLRDLARFGEMMRCDGAFNSQQIVPAAVVEDIRRGADPVHFARALIYSPTLPTASYRNMWWVTHDTHGAYTARGVHGQVIWIDPRAEMVIARYASHPMAANVHLDATSLPAYRALAAHLMA